MRFCGLDLSTIGLWFKIHCCMNSWYHLNYNYSDIPFLGTNFLYPKSELLSPWFSFLRFGGIWTPSLEGSQLDHWIFKSCWLQETCGVSKICQQAGLVQVCCLPNLWPKTLEASLEAIFNNFPPQKKIKGRKKTTGEKVLSAMFCW